MHGLSSRHSGSGDLGRRNTEACSWQPQTLPSRGKTWYHVLEGNVSLFTEAEHCPHSLVQSTDSALYRSNQRCMCSFCGRNRRHDQEQQQEGKIYLAYTSESQSRKQHCQQWAGPFYISHQPRQPSHPPQVC